MELCKSRAGVLAFIFGACPRVLAGYLALGADLRWPERRLASVVCMCIAIVYSDVRDRIGSL
jgi:hypothetical protein